MIRLRRAAVLLSLVAALTVSARASAATTYYVGSNGDDAAPGTSAERPWRTPARVTAADLAPGDRVLFEAGGGVARGRRPRPAGARATAGPRVPRRRRGRR